MDTGMKAEPNPGQPGFLHLGQVPQVHPLLKEEIPYISTGCHTIQFEAWGRTTQE